MDGASYSQGLAGHRYGVSQHHSQGLAGHTNHAVIHRALRGNDDRWIGHAMVSCRGFCILAPQCKAWWSAAGDSTVERYCTHTCGANSSRSSNLNFDGICKAGDRVLAFFKGPEVPYWSFRPFWGIRSPKVGKEIPYIQIYLIAESLKEGHLLYCKRLTWTTSSATYIQEMTRMSVLL